MQGHMQVSGTCHNQLRFNLLLCSGIVWSGEGSINGLKLDCKEKLSKEFLVCPNSPVEYVNTSQDQDLMVFVVFPIVSNGK